MARKGRSGWIVQSPLAVGLAVAGVLVAAFGARAQEVVKFGDVPTVANAGLYVAMEKGFFARQGIRIETERFASGGKMNTALSTGQLDGAVGSASAGLFNAVAEGADIRIVIGTGMLRPGSSYVVLVLRKDLAESGKFKQVRDLKGLRLAAFAKGTITDYVLDEMLTHGGISQRDVDMQYLAPPNIVKALAGKAIDGGILAEPWVARAEQEGVGVRFALTDPVPSLKDQQTATILFGGRFARERRDTARRFVQAYLDGVAYYTERGGTKDEEIVAILSKIIGADRDSLRRSTPVVVARDGRPDLEGLARMQDWFLKRGLQEKRMNPDQVVDLQFFPR